MCQKLIGDSYVYGVGVKNNQTIACHLTKLGISTYALSVPGTDIPIYLQVVEKHLENLKKALEYL